MPWDDRAKLDHFQDGLSYELKQAWSIYSDVTTLCRRRTKTSPSTANVISPGRSNNSPFSRKTPSSPSSQLPTPRDPSSVSQLIRHLWMEAPHPWTYPPEGPASPRMNEVAPPPTDFAFSLPNDLSANHAPSQFMRPPPWSSLQMNSREKWRPLLSC